MLVNMAFVHSKAFYNMISLSPWVCKSWGAEWHLLFMYIIEKKHNTKRIQPDMNIIYAKVRILTNRNLVDNNTSNTRGKILLSKLKRGINMSVTCLTEMYK